MKKWHVAFAVAAILALVGIVAVQLWFPNDTATEVSTDEVMARYRTGAASTTMTSTTVVAADRVLSASDATSIQTEAAGTTTADEPTPAEAEEAQTWFNGPLRLPEPGVYIYATTGMETIDALTGATHDYPEQTTITVTRDECGVRLRWDALEERADEHVFCIEGNQLIQPSLKEHHKFFGRDSDETYACTPPTVVFDITHQAGQTNSGPCTNEHETITSIWESMAAQPVETGAGKVDAIVLRNTFTSGVTPDESGMLRSDGEWGETDFYLHESVLPVRITRTKVTRSSTPVGTVNYHESYTLVLRDPEPMG